MNLSFELEALRSLEGKIGPIDGAELTGPIDCGSSGSRGNYGKRRALGTGNQADSTLFLSVILRTHQEMESVLDFVLNGMTQRGKFNIDYWPEIMKKKKPNTDFSLICQGRKPLDVKNIKLILGRKR